MAAPTSNAGAHCPGSRGGKSTNRKEAYVDGWKPLCFLVDPELGDKHTSGAGVLCHGAQHTHPHLTQESDKRREDRGEARGQEMKSDPQAQRASG